MADSHLYAVIMAGGKGQRLWPLSRQDRPKQALTLYGERSLFQVAVDRLLPLIPAERIFVSTTADYVDLLNAQSPAVPRANYVVEPAGRGTAPGIGLAAVHLLRRDPEAVMAVVTADHYIEKEDRFRAVLAAAAEVAHGDRLVTLGIEPSHPATGYGYIERGAPLKAASGFPVYAVERFTEKPPAERAAQMLASGRYSWNSGMFVWRAAHIMREFAEQMPDLHRHLDAIARLLAEPDGAERIAAVWEQVRTETIDYGIMERAQGVVVIPVDLGWSDVGSWQALLEMLPGDGDGNVLRGAVVCVDTRETLVHASGGRVVALIGLDDFVVVDTNDVLLICPAGRSQDVRRVVEALSERGRSDLL